MLLRRPSPAAFKSTANTNYSSSVPVSFWSYRGWTAAPVSYLDSMLATPLAWWSGVVVSALASINEVNLRRARLALRWATVSGFSSRCRTLISVRNQPATQGQLSLPSLRGR